MTSLLPSPLRTAQTRHRVRRIGILNALFHAVTPAANPKCHPPLARGDSGSPSTQRAVYVTHTEAEAREAVDQARWNMRVTLSLRQNRERVERGRAIAVPFEDEPSVDDLLNRFLVIGTPDTCIQRIKAMQEAMGIDHFNCSFWFGDMDQSKILQSMRLFSEEVMPAFCIDRRIPPNNASQIQQVDKTRCRLDSTF